MVDIGNYTFVESTLHLRLATSQIRYGLEMHLGNTNYNTTAPTYIYVHFENVDICVKFMANEKYLWHIHIKCREKEVNGSGGNS